MSEATTACMGEVYGYFQCAANEDETEEISVWLGWVF